MDVEQSLDQRISDRKGARPTANRAPRPNRAPAATPYARPPARSTEDAWTHDMYGQRGGARPAGGAGGFRPRAAEGRETRLLISNVHYEVSKEDLTNIFSRAGTIVDGPVIRAGRVEPTSYGGESVLERKKEPSVPRSNISTSSRSANYDRSGRSTGVATVQYENNKQAKDAINRFDGNLAKGQALNIRFDDYQPRATESMSKGGSDLLGRIEGGSKMRSDSSNVNSSGRGPAANGRNGGERSDSWARNAPRPARPAGPPARGGRPERGPRPARAEKSAPKSRKPATAEDLDKELDSYHAPAAKAAAPTAAADGDVDMA